MAVIWQTRQNNRLYEVRSAGATLRLYTNGAFHSQYNPNRLLTGGIWDMLVLPALFGSAPLPRVLMLGVGGGASIHALNRLLSPRSITGIELDPVHLLVAREHFHSDLANVTLVEADAIRWVGRTRRQFDLVIDDLFLDAPGDPTRPVTVDAEWLAKLAARTSRHGVLLQNHLSPALARAVVQQHRALLAHQFGSALLFSMPTYTNSILALYRDPANAKQGRQRAVNRVNSAERGAGRRLAFQCTTLF